jgi:taurine dioxygenase
MTAAASETELPWRALRPFGVEIQHDLSAPLSNAQEQQFVALLWQHNLVLARNQTLNMERQRELCRLAGQILIREGETGYLSTAGGSGTSTSELSWHADAAYTDAPFDAIALHAVDVIDDASCTAFANSEDAFRTLPAGLQRRLEDRQIEMISPAYDALGRRTCNRRDPVAMKRGEMPSIYTNPHNGRACIWPSELQASRILGLDWEESRDVLNDLFAHLYRPENILKHSWRNGDFVIWDNIALQHMRGSLADCGKRVLQRVIVGKEGTAPHIGGNAQLHRSV